MTTRAQIARLHLVNSVLDHLTGHDLYLAAKLLEGIEAAVGNASENLGELVARLHHRLLGRAPEAGFAWCEAEAGPLFARAELLSAIRRNAPRPRTTILVAQPPPPPPWLRRTKRGRQAEAERAETITQLQAAAARHAHPKSLLTVLFY
ncbi:MAG: hypothetical protein D6781_13155 [Verrucomicrobia bacterium]|nr:MAG: hypothetical protein D6781_13155 [Verrucomicrobiota bacterium]